MKLFSLLFTAIAFALVAEASDRPLLQPSGCKYVSSGFGAAGNVKLKVTKLTTGLKIPWGIGFLPTGDLLVTEREGQVRLVQKSGKLAEKPVITISVGEGGEGGLMGIAMHPDFSKNNLFYVYYTYTKQNKNFNRLERFKYSGDTQTAVSEKILLDAVPAGTFHNGGRIKFGPDGMLFIGTGDARTPSNSQDLKTTSGKILRMTADGEVPKDNPFKDSFVYIYGVRNTQGFDWLDEANMIVSDHGPSGDTLRFGHDEVTLVSAGQNMGWPSIIGCDKKDGMVTPLISWKTATPPGGAVLYTGDKIPEWKDSLILGILGGKHVQRVSFSIKDNQMSVASHDVYFEGENPDGYGRIRDVVVGPDGDIFLTTSNCDSRGKCPDDKDYILKITKN